MSEAPAAAQLPPTAAGLDLTDSYPAKEHPA